jgi:NAD(P)-dependent dehydrogenase (short-subunit alcohol dehydrogenase family)
MTKGIIDMVGVEKLAEGAPLQRIGDEDDLKGAAVLFASDAGKHITGQILAIDGGLTDRGVFVVATFARVCRVEA